MPETLWQKAHRYLSLNSLCLRYVQWLSYDQLRSLQWLSSFYHSKWKWTGFALCLEPYPVSVYFGILIFPCSHTLWTVVYVLKYLRSGFFKMIHPTKRTFVIGLFLDGRCWIVSEDLLHYASPCIQFIHTLNKYLCSLKEHFSSRRLVNLGLEDTQVPGERQKKGEASLPPPLTEDLHRHQ